MRHSLPSRPAGARCGAVRRHRLSDGGRVRQRQPLREVWVRNELISWVSFLLLHSGHAGALSCWLTDRWRVTVRPQASQRYSYLGMADPPLLGRLYDERAPRLCQTEAEKIRSRAQTVTSNLPDGRSGSPTAWRRTGGETLG